MSTIANLQAENATLRNLCARLLAIISACRSAIAQHLGMSVDEVEEIEKAMRDVLSGGG